MTSFDVPVEGLKRVSGVTEEDDAEVGAGEGDAGEAGAEWVTDGLGVDCASISPSVPTEHEDRVSDPMSRARPR